MEIRRSSDSGRLLPGAGGALLGTTGEVAEWSIAAVLKTAVGASSPGVRIPPSPPVFAQRKLVGPAPRARCVAAQRRDRGKPPLRRFGAQPRAQRVNPSLSAILRLSGAKAKDARRRPGEGGPLASPSPKATDGAASLFPVRTPASLRLAGRLLRLTAVSRQSVESPRRLPTVSSAAGLAEAEGPAKVGFGFRPSRRPQSCAPISANALLAY